MKHEQLVNAIQHIYPDGANFTIRDEEIIWLDETQTEPTEEEIEAGYEGYLAKVENDKLEAAAKKAIAEAKLALLGLDADDLKALGL
jgi:uncharacterized membrane protein